MVKVQELLCGLSDPDLDSSLLFKAKLWQDRLAADIHCLQFPKPNSQGQTEFLFIDEDLPKADSQGQTEFLSIDEDPPKVESQGQTKSPKVKLNGKLYQGHLLFTEYGATKDGHCVDLETGIECKIDFSIGDCGELDIL